MSNEDTFGSVFWLRGGGGGGLVTRLHIAEYPRDIFGQHDVVDHDSMTCTEARRNTKWLYRLRPLKYVIPYIL
jgi:hypothetical protein